MPVDAFLGVTREIGEETAALGRQGRHVIAEGSGHFVHFDEPELVLAAIEEVVRAARASAPGTSAKQRSSR